VHVHTLGFVYLDPWSEKKIVENKEK
jgi:hypothetical protein